MSKLAPQFLNNPSVQKLFEMLDTEAKPMLRVVGGAVRNHILNQPVKDVDFATVWTPDQVVEKCKSTGVRVVETGIDHGTVTIVLNGEGFEVTTLRSDIETDGRHAVVAFSSSWEEDARRRDFTMNALYMGRDGVVVDPLGQGLSDIDQKIVRFVGEASKRIEEDALRILRFYRFSLFYGEGGFDEKGSVACKNLVSLLQNLSKERITNELVSMCRFDQSDSDVGDRFTQTIEIMINNNVFSTIGESNPNLTLLKLLIKNQKTFDLENFLSRLYCLFSGCFIAVQSSLILSKKQLNFMRNLSQSRSVGDLSVKEMMYQYGRDVTQQTLMLDCDVLREDVECTKTWHIPVFPLAGQDLLVLGYKSGPEMGAVLKRVEQWWIENDFVPTKLECCEYASKKIIDLL